jgi:hypothetical protein
MEQHSSLSMDFVSNSLFPGGTTHPQPGMYGVSHGGRNIPCLATYPHGGRLGRSPPGSTSGRYRLAKHLLRSSNGSQSGIKAMYMMGGTPPHTPASGVKLVGLKLMECCHKVAAALRPRRPLRGLGGRYAT